jgi:hypothetical protein
LAQLPSPPALQATASPLSSPRCSPTQQPALATLQPSARGPARHIASCAAQLANPRGPVSPARFPRLCPWSLTRGSHASSHTPRCPPPLPPESDGSTPPRAWPSRQGASLGLYKRAALWTSYPSRLSQPASCAAPRRNPSTAAVGFSPPPPSGFRRRRHLVVEEQLRRRARR